MTGASGTRFYLTAAIDYVNGAPHLGHAYEKIGADAVVRWRAQRGDDVRFTVGSDEHSQSVLRAARSANLEVETYTERQKALFEDAFSRLDIGYTAYVRTSGEANRRTTERIMDLVHGNGHLYKGMYAAWFCPSCERFYTDKEVVDGALCPVHMRPVEWVEEENWFFRLSAFQEALLRHFDENPDFLTPASRRNEIRNVIRGGLEDISVSRAFSDWGFRLPFDPAQVVYVWFDALLAYLTGIGYADPDDPAAFDRYWPADVHVIGKDITRFHAVMWPAMLMAAGLPLPRRVHSHGFVTLGGRKMSKSSGVGVDPFALAARFGSDAVRYVLLAEVPFDRDGEFSIETFVDRYNADLANDYGNLVSRTEKMVARYFTGQVPEEGRREADDDALAAAGRTAVDAYESAMARLDLSEAIAAAQRLVAHANRSVEVARPWELHKAGDDRLGTVCRGLLEAIRVSTLLLSPFIPRAAARVADDLGVDVRRAPLDGLAEPALRTGAPIATGDILFPRLDRDAVVDDLGGAGGGQGS
ncbi:MAG TPA: methionine--tRNA ligase [Candidatus Dormibacteraeota bacterium]|nr:methionine--tRNA ligase [Candidatus Dormibacteraeota bacterium]